MEFPFKLISKYITGGRIEKNEETEASKEGLKSTCQQKKVPPVCCLSREDRMELSWGWAEAFFNHIWSFSRSCSEYIKTKKPFFLLFFACAMKRMRLPSLQWEQNHSTFAQILLQCVWFTMQLKGTFTTKAFRQFSVQLPKHNTVWDVSWVQLLVTEYVP